MIIKNCLVCKKEYKTYGTRDLTAKFCSRKCNGVGFKGKNNPFYGKKHTISVREKISKSQQNKICLKGELSHSWKGNDIKKEQRHARIIKKLGKPNYCEHCKRTDKKRYDWANKDHKYNLEIKDWLRLCRSCHIKYDIENNNYGGFWWNSTQKHPTKK